MMEPALPEQGELLRRIGVRLLERLPGEWAEVRLTYHAVRKHKAIGVQVRTPDGAEEELEITPAVHLDLEKLRKGMYQQGKGTWFLMEYRIVPPGRYSVDFDYDSEPDFFGVPSVDGTADSFSVWPNVLAGQ
ncbi:hypothetical protein ACFQXA_21385 [Nocardiopsis composta]